MAASRAIPIVLLLGIVVTAHFALAWQSEKNGTFSLQSVFAYTNRILPGTNIAIKIPETGIPTVDNYFAFMMSFFYAALDTRNVRARLQANYLLGTLSGTWLIMLTEAHRSTTSTAFFLLTYFAELMGEFLGIGLFTPIWCILHLFLTSAPSPRSQVEAEVQLSAPKGGLQALGYALLIGHVAPTSLMAMTKIEATGLASQQLWTILRLFHPMFVLVAYRVIRSIQNSAGAKDDPPAQRLANKRKIYLFSILASAFGHVSTLSILLAQHWIPNWLRADVLEALDLKTIVFPTPFWFENPVKMVPFVTGVATFLQWDNICSATAIFIWASSLYAEVLIPNLSRVNISSVFNVIVQTASISLLAGPVAGAAFVLQERDAIAVAYAGQTDNKKRQ